MVQTRNRVRTVYALCEPAEVPIVRYVGCTAQKVANRVQAHVHEAVTTETETPKLTWLRGLILNNLEPLVMILETVPASTDWELRERFWIAKYAGPNLFNAAVGGVGHRDMPMDVRRKIATSLTGRTRSTAAVAKQRATVAANPYRHTDEQKARIGAAHRGRSRGALPAETKARLAARMSSLIWITDGSTNRRVPDTDALPTGWRPGRCKAA